MTRHQMMKHTYQAVEPALSRAFGLAAVPGRARPVRRAVSWLLLLAATTACSLDVTNPGPVQDDQLNTPAAMPALVTGMAGDLSLALGNSLIATPLMADELRHSGNYAAQGQFDVGAIRPEDVNGIWADMQGARWTAEDGLRRMQAVLGSDFETSPLAPRAYLYGGFANRLLGENMCQAVIDGGPAQSDSVYFERADSLFTRAYELATAQGTDSLATAALAGRASVRAWLGDWAGAVADAAQVPAAFEFDAIFSLNTTRENMELAHETQVRRELTVWGTRWADSYGDPRTPWDTVRTSSGAVLTGQDGETPFFRQQKYPGLDSPVPLAKGTEMLLLRAEAALRDGDAPTAMTLINEERATYGLGPLTAATVDEAWPILQSERGAVLWLEGRRLWDLRRWNAATGAAYNGFLEGRDSCIPISASEQASNSNL